ncbi:MAG TPA: hypothetical protein VGJ87_05025 [Roseiflexaceae bacterium]
MSTATAQFTTSPATDLERALVSLLTDAKTAATLLDRLDDSDLAFDLGCELHSARKALQRAFDVLDAAAQPVDHFAAEPRSCQTPAGLVVSYA